LKHPQSVGGFGSHRDLEQFKVPSGKKGRKQRGEESQKEKAWPKGRIGLYKVVGYRKN
jgi:hypothetical protein